MANSNPTAQHTPFKLPLHNEGVASIWDADNNPVAMIQMLAPVGGGNEQVLRASQRQRLAMEYIITAVNAHDKLVEACRSAFAILEGNIGGIAISPHAFEARLKAVERLRSALKEAGEA